MSKKTNTTLVGMFVIAGLLLFLLAIFVFSSNLLFVQRMTFYSFFDTSLNGLDVGAPVKFKGVRVGSVKAIEVIYNNALNEVTTAVIFDINANLFRTDNGKKIHFNDYENFYSEQIGRGLAAKLSLESILTGKLYVGLDYYAKQARFYEDVVIKKNRQMPSVPTELDEFMATFDVIMKKLSKVKFDQAVSDFILLLENANDKIKHFNVEPIMNAMSAISRILSSDSSTRQALDDVLRQLAKSLRSLRVLLDLIERTPNALLAGKAQ